MKFFDRFLKDTLFKLNNSLKNKVKFKWKDDWEITLGDILGLSLDIVIIFVKVANFFFKPLVWLLKILAPIIVILGVIWWSCIQANNALDRWFTK